MSLWFLQDIERLRRERAAVDGLRSTTTWLTSVEWSFTEKCITIDAVITINGHDHEVRMRYPQLFPNAPIGVSTPTATFLWTRHQYGGKHGTLCLEYGPDNWNPEITGGMMLESTWRLLDAERPLERPGTPVTPVPSRHALTPGQDARGENFRIFYTEEFLAELKKLEGYRSLKWSWGDAGSTIVAVVHEMGESDQRWSDPGIPADFRNEPRFREGGLGVGVPSTKPFAACKTVSELNAVATELGLPPTLFAVDGSSPLAGLADGVTVIYGRDDPKPYGCYRWKDGTVSAFHSVFAGTAKTRLPEGRSLAGKKIAIVGLGSAGSKIAVSLARSGATQFTLVDHDLLLPQNLVRHALDWSAVGFHKTEGIAETLKRIIPAPALDLRCLHLTGQESNRSIAIALDRIGACDLIVDATAEGAVFNILSGVAGSMGKPLVWFEVFGGGIGGLVARSRPGLDPAPQLMRALFLQYCNEHPYSGMRTEGDYDVTEGGKVLTASDADVAIIAHHAARLAEDILTASSSGYPYSMYLVGLAKAWVFDGPFATIPLDTAGLASAPSAATTPKYTEEDIAFVASLFPDAHATSSSG